MVLLKQPIDRGTRIRAGAGVKAALKAYCRGETGIILLPPDVEIALTTERESLHDRRGRSAESNAAVSVLYADDAQ
jgi:hypothetical protein